MKIRIQAKEKGKEEWGVEKNDKKAVMRKEKGKRKRGRRMKGRRRERRKRGRCLSVGSEALMKSAHLELHAFIKSRGRWGRLQHFQRDSLHNTNTRIHALSLKENGHHCCLQVFNTHNLYNPFFLSFFYLSLSSPFL